ncbi:MAG: hypothetical protein WBF71_05060 [Microthrixaceae bacterium]
MSRKTIHRPGELVLTSGQYGVVNSYGTYMHREVTCVRGEKFPPVHRSRGEYGFVLRDATRH